jgi:hypothetical protein
VSRERDRAKLVSQCLPSGFGLCDPVPPTCCCTGTRLRLTEGSPGDGRWVKGYFRRGDALLALKEFARAEGAFMTALEMGESRGQHTHSHHTLS